ncbi:MAG: aminotransferase class III-fold pyridoxal phosphate-dependent enzyme, partial [Pseudomonadota bacterium]
MASSCLMNTYAPLDVAFTHGNGMYLYDTQGNQYFDALAGIATCNLGHAHPAVTDAIQAQAGKLIHCSNVYLIPEQEALATALCGVADMDNV